MNRSERTAPTFDAEIAREDFPILHQHVHGKPLVYLDNAASTQKPRCVIDALVRYYERDNSNIHRAIHVLSDRATRQYEAARETIRRFLGAADTREIIFCRGTTEAINLVAHSYCKKFVHSSDEVLITQMEHHSNIVPWQIACEERQAKLKVAPIDDRGEIVLEAFEKLLTDRVKIVSLTHVSNTLGTINPVRAIIEMAHRKGIPVMLDGAQAVSHMKVDVQELDVDFYAFSGHKVYGPTGIGVLYGKSRWLEAMPPFMGGGDMIRTVTFEKTTWNELPYKFEAGTPNVEGPIGLAVALDYLEKIGIDQVSEHEQTLLRDMANRLADIPGIRLIGTPRERAGAVSFVLEGVHANDVGVVLDQEGIAIRSGHHCTQPLMQRFGIAATARPALALYNTQDEINALIRGIHKVKKLFGV
ncbi:MAG: cysteine desulfurase [Gemmataceae bacterium]|nr:cysteine desulfurase [Gemmataceae bacterium]